MAVNKGRIVAGFFAGLFILSTLMISVGVIFQMIQDSKQPDLGQAAQHATQTDVNDASKETTVTKLQGTKLAGFTPIPSVASLQKIDTTPGTGETVKKGATITVDYTGALASTGVIFESSKDSGQPATFPLDQVIKGWTEGIPGMQVGGTRRLVIPASLAYGSQSKSTIPANSDLVFDVTLIKIDK